MQVALSSIENVSFKVLTKIGVSNADSRIITDTIVFANQRGVSTHGIGRLPLYVKKVNAGHINVGSDIKTIIDSNAIAVLDANNCFGQVAAFEGIQLAIQKAKEYGISAVGVRNSNNFGTAGYFGDLAARKGLVCMIYANAAPAIAPTGGTKTIFGTNPICYAFPGTNGMDPILLDMATTVVARGKIRLAAKNGEKIPLDWAIGPDGEPTNDPNVALMGSLLPIAGYKGYGLSLFVDLLAGLLTGSAHAGDVKNLSNMNSDSGNGHLFIVIDTMRFIDKDLLRDEVVQFCQKVKQCGPEGKIFLPGEKEYEYRRSHQIVVDISRKQFEEINEIALSLGLNDKLEEIN